MRILQIANYSENGGGISVQVRLLQGLLQSDGFDCGIISTKGSLVTRIKAVFRLLVNGKDYGVFHIHACSGRGFFPAIIGIGIGRFLNKRTVLTFHGGGAEEFFNRKRRLVKYFLNKTSANIVLSGFIGRVFDKYGIKYTVIPNIITMDESSFKIRTTIKPRYISIRSLTETYNIPCTLKAFSIVQSKYPEATLTLLGDGPSRPELEKFVAEHNIPNVTFAGQVPNTDIYRYLGNADIMVSSSRFDNMPVSILEGFKAGLLVIASNVGGVPYMIDDGENGLLFENGNDPEMADKMIEAITHPDATIRMIENAFRSLDTYKWVNCRERLLATYKG